MLLREARDLYELHLNETGDVSPNTRRAYVSDVGVLGAYAGPDVPLLAVDAALLQTFVVAQRSAAASETSTRRRVAAIRQFLAWARSADLTVADGAAAFRVAVRRGRRLPRAVPAEDLRRILGYLGGGDASAQAPRRAADQTTTLVAVALMVGTGLRVGEVADVRCGDVDGDLGSVRVRGKGSRERTVFLGGGWLSELTSDHLAGKGPADPRDHLLLKTMGTPLSAAAI